MHSDCKPKLRLHDLRRSFASVAVNTGPTQPTNAPLSGMLGIPERAMINPLVSATRTASCLNSTVWFFPVVVLLLRKIRGERSSTRGAFAILNPVLAAHFGFANRFASGDIIDDLDTTVLKPVSLKRTNAGIGHNQDFGVQLHAEVFIARFNFLAQN